MTGAAVGAAGVAASTSHATGNEHSHPPQNNSALSAASQKQMSASSLQAYQAERTQARTPPMPVNTNQVRNDPVYSSARNSFGGNADTYYRQRTEVYTVYRQRYPDVVVINQNLRPNYGIYDSGFLTGMVMGYVGSSMIHNATWMAAQQNQPWYPQYRADLERQAQSNAELRAKLAAMDEEIVKLKAQNIPTTASKLPEGVNPALAIAPEAVIADTPEKSSYWWLWGLLGFGVGAGIVVLIMRC